MHSDPIRASFPITDISGLPIGIIHVVQRRDPLDFAVVSVFNEPRRHDADQYEIKSFTDFFKALNHAAGLAGWRR